VLDVAVELSEENRRQFWLPRGFGHGFLVLSQSADFFYKDELHSPADEIVVRWNDPAIGIAGASRLRPCRCAMPPRRCRHHTGDRTA
jgi:dTDP-4-dehydrorhamnose 3,5-epimerase-like enzyme